MEIVPVDTLSWSDITPVINGHYWWRYAEEDRNPEIVYVYDDKVFLLKF